MIHEIDARGFPIVLVESVRLWVQWLPVTKIQLERFLCETVDRRFDAAWYAALLQLNPRISPHAVNATNYWQALASGILPHEAESYARWIGGGYRLPADAEWRQLYAALKAVPARELPAGLPLARLPERDRELLTGLDRAVGSAASGTAKRSLADLMLLRGGLMEWVDDRDNNPLRWSGRGEPPRSFHGGLTTADDVDPSRPNEPTERRLEHYGCRLVKAA